MRAADVRSGPKQPIKHGSASHHAVQQIHRKTTGPEIVQAMEGIRFDWYICAYGTGGTLKGVGQVLRERRPETKSAHVAAQNASPARIALIMARHRLAHT